MIFTLISSGCSISVLKHILFFPPFNFLFSRSFAVLPSVFVTIFFFLPWFPFSFPCNVYVIFTCLLHIFPSFLLLISARVSAFHRRLKLPESVGAPRHHDGGGRGLLWRHGLIDNERKRDWRIGLLHGQLWIVTLLLYSLCKACDIALEKWIT